MRNTATQGVCEVCIISAKSLAEFVFRPITDQMRILAEQKRPSAGAAAFKVHYYQASRAAVKGFFANGNDPNRISLDIAKIASSSMIEHKRRNNERALRAFIGMNQLTSRKLLPQIPKTLTLSKFGTTVRLTPDFVGTESNRAKLFLFNYGATPLDSDIARVALELMYWVTTWPAPQELNQVV